MTALRLHFVETLDDANEFMRWLGTRRQFLAVDTETGGFDWWRDALRTIQFGDAEDGWCMERDQWGGLAKEALLRYDGAIAMANAKFDLHFLEVNGFPVKRHLVHDVMVMAHLLDSSVPIGLKSRASRLLGPWARHGEEELKLAMMHGNWTYADVPIELLWQYAAFDTVLTARVAELQWPHIASGFSSLYDLEMAVVQVLTTMERKGALVDRAYLEHTHEQWELDVRAAAHELREHWGVENPHSRQQLAQRMAKDGVEFVSYTPSGKPQMTEDVLETLDHPVARLASTMFKRAKYKVTYIDSLIELADKHGVVHCQVHPLGARTGRMSASRPPLQQLPRSREVRDAFIPRPGNAMVLADYDQIEMRLLAAFSGDTAMIEAVRTGDDLTQRGIGGWDLHSANARKIYGIADDQPVPKDKRQFAKSGGFSKVYGAGVAKFAMTVGTDLGTAAAFMAQYDSTFPGVQRFMQMVQHAVRDRATQNAGLGWLMSPYGRRHLVEADKAYKGVNYLIQGTAADVLKDRLVAMARSGLLEYMVLPVHDEVMLDVPLDRVADVLDVLRVEMPERDKFSVPLTVGVDVVQRWGEKYA